MIKRDIQQKIEKALENFRNLRKKEVDFVLEAKDGAIIAIEVKAKSVINKSDLKGLSELAHNTDKLLNGFIIYSGEEIRPIASDGFIFYLIPLKLFC